MFPVLNYALFIGGYHYINFTFYLISFYSYLKFGNFYFLLFHNFTDPYAACFINIFNMPFIAVLIESFTKC
jgi:hypothetical protein